VDHSPTSGRDDEPSLVLHRTLARQLRLHKLTTSDAPSLEAWQQLLNEVSAVYIDNDVDREMLERSVDISSKEMQDLNALLAKQASTDAMTGLHNRSTFMKELDRHLSQRSKDDSQLLGLLFIDLDGFKIINDRLGHSVGDDVLCIVANRLRTCVRENDVLARLGGDEFVVLSPNLNSASLATKLADRIVASVSQTINLPNIHPIGVGASIGVTTITSDEETDSERLLVESDLAMYSAKMNGRNRVVTFTPGLESSAQVPSGVDELTDAIAKKQLVLHYQPLVCMAHSRVVGMEALVRWQHPEHGLIPPDEFIPLAESSGLIHDLTQLVLEQALEALASWPSDLFVTVNLSPKDLAHTDIASSLKDQIHRAGVDASRVVLELTENCLISWDDRALNQLQSIIDLGAYIAIVDFGSGYSSLSQLINLPIQIVKLDRKFIDPVSRNDASNAVVQTVIELARVLGLSVVAEGIETVEQAEILSQLGCDLGQGYHCTRPISNPVLEIGSVGCKQCELARANYYDKSDTLRKAS
jgi:diguanylate cyclase (GGDEF)-like protein